MNDESFLFESQYRILRPIAEGGMGRVYLAEQLGKSGFSKTVAIKVIHSDHLRSSVFRDLFIGEAKLTADLVHENILQVYQLIDIHGADAIVMEYVHGVTIEGINARLDDIEDYIQPDLAAFIVSRVARALAYAHTKRSRDGRALGIVHRDVTPSNILINWQGVVKLSDFGIAKAADIRSIDENQAIVGKTPYLSPEQARHQGADALSDIFALGLVLYEALVGRIAYPTNDVKELLAMHGAGPPTSVLDYNPDIPSHLEAIMLRMMAFDRAARFQSAAEVVTTLELYLYASGYGPTNEKLRDYLEILFPNVDKTRIDLTQPKPTPVGTRSTTSGESKVSSKTVFRRPRTP